MKKVALGRNGLVIDASRGLCRIVIIRQERLGRAFSTVKSRLGRIGQGSPEFQ